MKTRLRKSEKDVLNHGSLTVVPSDETEGGAQFPEQPAASVLAEETPVLLYPPDVLFELFGVPREERMPGWPCRADQRCTGRPNLVVVTGVLARRLTIEDGRCTGVEYTADGRVAREEATEEVVLTAGAVGSPHLLMVSGVGPAAHLRHIGVDVRVDSPGVGANLHEHPRAPVFVRTSACVPAASRLGSTDQFLLRFRSDPSRVEPDIEVVGLDSPIPSADTGELVAGFSLWFGVMKPASRGSVRLAGSDMETPPVVDPGYLTARSDLDRMVQSLRVVRRIIEQKPLAHWIDEEIAPGPGVRSDEECAAYVRATLTPFFHQAGTCRIGSDVQAVVDPMLRVHGVQGLRVADASVMPTPVSANTNATVLAIAEKASELITTRE